MRERLVTTLVDSPGGPGEGDRRSGDRRQGDRRRSLVAPVTAWEQPAWDRQGYTGPERRLGDRRFGDRRDRGRDRPHAAPEGVEYYSDEWARAYGSPSFTAWLEHLATAPPPGLR